MRVNISEDAKTDIKEIYIYSYQNFGEKKADEYLDGLDEKLNNLPTTYISSGYSFVREGLRRSNYESHAVYYRIDGNDLIILRILHQQMDPARHINA